jgi:glycolate oxidase iron-sulfur subunit
MYLKLHSDYEGDALAHEAAAIIKSCVHCGFCNATCPTYQEFFDERDGPRGRIYLVKHMLESGQAGDATRMHLDRCLTCRACETTCPSGVRYGRLADIGREIIEEKTQRPVIERLQRLFARKVFPHPGRVRMLLRLGRLVQWFLPSQLRRQIPPKQKLSAPAGKQSSSQRKMIVLKGCVQAEATPRTNDAARRVLQRLGIDLLEAASAGCCGALSYHLAARDEGLDFMRRNIDAWWPLVEAGAEAIVSTASACGVMISDYGEQLKDDPAYSTKARRVSELAKDLTEVLEAEDTWAKAGRLAGARIGKVRHTAGRKRREAPLLRFRRYVFTVAAGHQPATTGSQTCGAVCREAGTDSDREYRLPVTPGLSIRRAGKTLDRITRQPELGAN